MAFLETPGAFSPINMWAMLRNLINQDVPLLTNAGVPTNGAAGTYFGQAGPGALIIDTTNGVLYQNTNTKLSPTWTRVSIPSTGVTEAQLSASSGTGLGVMRVAHAIYSFAVDGGVIGAITPVLTAVIPANAIMVAGTVNSTTAVTSAGAATVSVGTTAGSSAASILAATGKASFTLDALLNSALVFATPIKMTAAGSINITVGTAALTAGILEIFVAYYVAANA